MSWDWPIQARKSKLLNLQEFGEPIKKFPLKNSLCGLLIRKDVNAIIDDFLDIKYAIQFSVIKSHHAPCSEGYKKKM